MGEAKRGAVTKLDLARVGTFTSNRFVTAMRDDSEKLRLIAWDVSNNGVPQPKGAVATDGTIKDVAVAWVSGSRIVTAVRDSADELRLIAWDISQDGLIFTRRGTRTGSRVQSVAAAPGHGLQNVFTACKDWSGNLQVGRWPVDQAGQIGTPSIETFGGASEISVTRGISNVAALRDADGRLRLIHFLDPLRRVSTAVGEEISKVSVVDTQGGGAPAKIFSATASPGPTGVRTGIAGGGRLLIGAGTLKLTSWRLDTGIFGNLVREAEVEVGGLQGIAFEVGIAELSTGSLVVTAHLGVGTFRKLLERDRGKPNLRLIAWERADDRIVKQAETKLQGKFESLAVAPLDGSPPNVRFVTAMRDKSGHLQVVVWAFVP